MLVGVAAVAGLNRGVIKTVGMAQRSPPLLVVALLADIPRFFVAVPLPHRFGLTRAVVLPLKRRPYLVVRVARFARPIAVGKSLQH